MILPRSRRDLRFGERDDQAGKDGFGSGIVVTAVVAARSGASAATHVGATFTPGSGNSCLGGPDSEVLQTGRASGPS
jgi:hypothetical protein